MRYGLLGTLDVRTDDGVPVTIAAPKRRALLTILLLHGNHPVTRDALIDALWAGEPPDAAVESIHAHIARLRRELGAGELVTEPGGYTLRVADRALDSAAFAADAGRGRSELLAGRPQQAHDILAVALATWRGPALSDVASEPFALAEVARLEELRLGALEDRVEADLALGRDHELVAELEALVAEHPYRERLAGLLIIALYRTGRQADALEAFLRTRRRLADDLGLDPSPALRSLQLRVLRQDQGLAMSGAAAARPSRVLPEPVTSFVGREAEVGAVVQLLSERRMVTLTGPGGVGKTRLAIRVAETSAGAYPDGVAFVDLSTVIDSTRVLERIGEDIGGGSRPEDVIGGRRLLLVLDNFEQVVEAAPEVAMLLVRCPNLHVLVTSRTPLRLSAEARLPVPPLDPGHASQLFEQRASAELRNATLDRDVVGAIVERLDGLPLAIELAATRVPTLGLKAILDRLDDQLGLLAGGPRDAPDRHRTLRATVSWSYDLLTEPVQAAFRCLAVMAPGFDLEAAIAVARTDLETVATLVEHSLLRQEDGRYAMLDSIRAFAGERAAARDDLHEARDRHLAWYGPRPLESRRAGGPSGARHEAWLQACAADRDNYRLAFDWALTSGDADALVELFRGMGMYWLFVGITDEGLRWADAAVATAPSRSHDERMTILMVASEYRRYTGDFSGALELKERALAELRAADDVEGMTTALDDIGWTHAARGDYDAAWSAIGEAQALHDRVGSGPTLALAHTLATTAEILLRQDRIDEALAAFEAFTAAEDGIEDWPDWLVEGDVLRGQTMLAVGREAEARAAFGRVVDRAAGMEFRSAVADALDGLAELESRSEPRSAARLIGMADRLRAETRTPVWLAPRRARMVDRVRSVLDAVEYDGQYAAGRDLSVTMAPAVAGD
jgi:predicted ATPase/DNA-binding SARP family transcriptional activator